MFTFLQKKRAETHFGFTLIELLVVIAIIGILASIILASLNNARSKARDSKRVTDVKQLQLALELYFDGQGAGAYPEAVTSGSGANVNGLPTAADLVTTGYIPQLPTPPTGASGTCSGAYCYASPSGVNTTYHLGVRLENTGGVLNTDKDCNSGAADPSAAGCAGGITATMTGGFDGLDPVFDVQP